MKLAYEAIDKSGRAFSDVIDASDLTDASDMLRRKGLFVTRLVPSGADAAQVGNAKRKSGSKGRRLKNLAIFTRQLFVLVSTGTQITQSLRSLQRQMKEPAWQNVIADVCDRVEQGEPLSEALAEHPLYFDAIYCSLVAAGESSGKLPSMLDRLANLTRQQMHVRNTIMGAMVYPILLVTVSVFVLALMLTVVLPRFTELFDTLDVPLPPTTVALVMLSDFLRGFWWMIVLGIVGGGFAARYWLRTEKGKRQLDTALVRAPQIGSATRSFVTARIARLLGILLDSHLPLLDVLALVRKTVGNSHYIELMKDAEDAVTRGDPISCAFKDPKLINPSVYEAMRSGEHSGKVGFVLLSVADFMDEENEMLVKALLSILEPLILIVLGVLVGFVAVSMFMPLFDLTSMTAGGA